MATWDGEASFFLIEDAELRAFSGEVIGLIAESYWWAPEELERRLPKSLGAGPGVPAAWTVDPLRVAILLRVGDAAHVDHRRAPPFLSALLKPQGASKPHWEFQQRIGKPSISDDSLLLTSGPSFPWEVADSWWLAYDTACMIDKELQTADAILTDSGRPRLAARRVKGADSPVDFSRHVRPDGWEPVNASLRVGNVPAIVEQLGGKALYSDRGAAIRELVQNAVDAVRARRLLQDRPENWGAVVLDLGGEDGHVLSVCDDGIGMSERTMTGSLLDFGRSLWSSDDLARELPGASSKGVTSIGRFGIGFFSVFMLGSDVRVRSRKFDAGMSATLELSFSGLSGRPLLRKADVEMTDPGTCVRVSVTEARIFERRVANSSDEPRYPRILDGMRAW